MSGWSDDHALCCRYNGDVCVQCDSVSNCGNGVHHVVVSGFLRCVLFAAIYQTHRIRSFRPGICHVHDLHLCYRYRADQTSVKTPLSFVLGLLMSSWAGGFVLSVGEWFIKQVPLVKNIYSASKQVSCDDLQDMHADKGCGIVLQVSAALNPDNEATRAFKECVLIKHPRNGEFAFGFITGETWVHVGVCL